MARRNDLRRAHPGDGRKAAVPGTLEYLDDAGRESPGHGIDRNQDPARNEGARGERGGIAAGRIADTEAFSRTMPHDAGPSSPNASRKASISTSKPDRAEAARYGLTIDDIQRAVASGIGGENIAENIEGRERYPINVRYARDFRNGLQRMLGVLLATPSGAQIPLGEVARVSFHTRSIDDSR